MKHSKIWGSTQEIFNGINFEVHRIEIEKGGYSSKHLHRFKHNYFFIESGLLKIQSWKEGGIIDATILSPGESTSVCPNMYHKFSALQDTIAYEIYWMELPKEDIVREDQGGIKKLDDNFIQTNLGQ